MQRLMGIRAWIAGHRWQSALAVAVIMLSGATVVALARYANPSTTGSAFKHASSSATAQATDTPSASATPTVSTITPAASATATPENHHPSRRSNAALAFDHGSNQLVMFGGTSVNNQVLVDTWTWDGKRWTEQFPTDHPGSLGVAAWDGASGHVTFIGRDGTTWTWNGSDWSQTSATVPLSWSGTAAWDDDLNKIVLVISGSNGAATWVLTGNGWQDLHIAGPNGGNFSMDYDRVMGKMLLYQGSNSSTWSFDGRSWQQLPNANTPSLANGLGSVTRTDGELTEMLLNGSTTNPSQTETWAWNGSQWQHKDFAPASIPGQRYALNSNGPAFVPGVAFDGAIREAVLFGGGDPSQAFAQETYIWDGMRWFNCRDVGCDG